MYEKPKLGNANPHKISSVTHESCLRTSHAYYLLIKAEDETGDKLVDRLTGRWMGHISPKEDNWFAEDRWSNCGYEDRVDATQFDVDFQT